MPTDRDELEELNLKIGEAEAAGNRELLESLVGPRLAFRRANGDWVDRSEYLGAVGPAPPRETQIEGIDILGANRAIVTCIVTVKGEGAPRRFHNARLFVRDAAGRWKLLGWANEPV